MNRREFLVGAGSIAIAAKPLFAATQTATRSGVFPGERAGGLSFSPQRDLPELGVDASGGHRSPRMRSRKSSTIGSTAPAAEAWTSARRAQEELKAKFGALINAKATEIAYTANTSDGENIVVMGLDLAKQKGVEHRHRRAAFHDLPLHVQGARKERRRAPHRQAQELGDRSGRHGKAIDKNTKLVSMAMVSNVNGFMHDVKAVTAIAHSRGAHVFADIIQAVGAVPVDVKALGTRLRLVRHLQVADGRARHRIPLRARGPARHGAADDEIRASAGVELQPRKADVGTDARRGAIRDRRHPGDDGRGRQRRHRLRQQAAASRTSARTRSSSPIACRRNCRRSATSR